MGAYENPIAVIDTESAKIFANAISNVGKTVSGMLDQEAQRKSEAKKQEREWLDWTFKYTNENLDKVYDQLQNVGVNNTEAFNAVKGLIDEKTKFGIAAKRASTIEEQNELLSKSGMYEKGIRSFINVQKGFQENDSVFNKEFVENIDKVGKEGGVPLVGGKNKEYNLGMSIRSGINPGKEEFYFDSEKGNWRVKYTGPEITKAGLGEIDMDASVFASYDPGTIPEISKNIYSLFSEKSESNPKGLGFLGKDGQLSQQYVNTEDIKYQYSKDGKLRTEIFPAKVGEMTAQATTFLTAQAEGLLRSGNQAQVVWQNVLSSGDDELKPGASGSGIYEKESEEKFIKAYVEKGLQSIPKYKVGKTSDAPVVKTTTTKEGAAQAKVYNKAKTLTDDILRANSGKNSRFFINKELDGMSISSAQWSGDTLNLVLDKPSGDGITEIPRKFEMNRREDVEDLVALLAQERYGKDASAEEIRDMTSMILRERQADRQPKINTSYE
jgi:hypothetical protein